MRLAKLCTHLGESLSLPHSEACDYLTAVPSRVPLAAKTLAAALQLAELASTSCRKKQAREADVLELLSSSIDALGDLHPVAFSEWDSIEDSVSELSISDRIREIEAELGPECVADAWRSFECTRRARHNLAKRLLGNGEYH